MIKEKFDPKGVAQLLEAMISEIRSQLFIAGIEDVNSAIDTAKFRIIENNPNMAEEIKLALYFLEQFVDFKKAGRP